MPTGRPDRKELLFPDALRRMRKAVGFRTARAFAKAVTTNEETVGHYERGERRPSEGMVADMVRTLEETIAARPSSSALKKLDPTTLVPLAEHDRPLWDAAEAAAKAAQAAAESDTAADDATTEDEVAEKDQPIPRPTVTVMLVPPLPLAVRGADGRWYVLRLAEEEEPEDNNGGGQPDPAQVSAAPTPAPLPDPIPAPVANPAPTPARTPAQAPQPTQPPQFRSARARRLWPVMAAVTVIVFIAVLAFNLRLPSLPNRYPVLVATVTHIVRRAPSVTPTRTPTQVPTIITAYPTILAHAPGYNPTVSVKLTFVGPNKCDWDTTIMVQGFPIGALLAVTASATGYDCRTGAAANFDDLPSVWCVVQNGVTCRSHLSYSYGCCPDLTSWAILGWHRYFITDDKGDQVLLTANN